MSRNDSRGPKDHINIRISPSGSHEQYKGDTRNHALWDPYVYVVCWAPRFKRAGKMEEPAKACNCWACDRNLECGLSAFAWQPHAEDKEHHWLPGQLLRRLDCGVLSQGCELKCIFHEEARGCLQTNQTAMCRMTLFREHRPVTMSQHVTTT